MAANLLYLMFLIKAFTLFLWHHAGREGKTGIVENIALVMSGMDEKVFSTIKAAIRDFISIWLAQSMATAPPLG